MAVENGRIDVAALNDLDMASEETAHDEAPAKASPPVPASSESGASEYAPDGHCDCAADEAPDLPFSAPQRHKKIRSAARGLLKPLLAVATAQYALVTILAGLTAYAVASNASKLVNANLEPLIAALKRL